MPETSDDDKPWNRAVRLLARRSPARQPALDTAHLQQLLLELAAHQTELERENEALRSAHNEVEQQLARYRQLFDAAPVGYATLDSQGITQELNHVGASLLQIDRHRLVGHPLALRVAAADRARFLDMLEQARAGQRPIEFEIELATRSPSFAHVTAAATRAIRPMFLLTFSDVTARKRHEAQLWRTEDALRQADRRKDEFLAALSHELRNPLAPIRNCMFLLTHDGANLSTEKTRATYAIMERQVAHLSSLVDDLLDVTRIQRGKIDLRVEPIRLDELLRHVIDDQRCGFEASGIRLESEIESETLWVRADRARLVQVITNVLGNAEKFTPRGGLVSISLRRAGEQALLRVRDTGAGIAPDMLERMFEPFTQAPQTMEHARGGLGLGLSMVKGLVELHGGGVHMNSPGIGHGSELTIALPLMAAPVRAPIDRPAPTAVSRRIFVIEDNTDAADTLHHALTTIGHEVEVSYDGSSAVEHARKFVPDVVLCDIGLPGMDGYDVARAFRADELLHRSYLIALSGYALPEDLQRASDAGFNRHIAKPPSLRALSEIISAAPRVGASQDVPTSD